AFLSPSDDSGFASLQRQAIHLDAIIPDWLQITRIGGNLDLQNDRRSLAVVRWLRHAAPHVKIYPQVTSRLTANETGELLASPRSRMRLIDHIAEHLRQNRFKGVTISLPDLPLSSHRKVVVCREELGKNLLY